MIDLWENKNIGEKINLWMLNNTGIFMDEPGLRKFRFARPNPFFSSVKTSVRNIPGGLTIWSVSRVFIVKERVLFGPGNIAVEK